MPDLKTLFENIHTIAIVGFSADEQKPAHFVPRYLRDAGYRIIPVNPKVPSAWNERGYASLKDIPEVVDAVLVFRRPEYCPDVVRDALAMPHQPLVIWLQSGIISPEAQRLAGEAGIPFIQDRCMKVEHQRLYD
jgi:predicted CoA-binding protein